MRYCCKAKYWEPNYMLICTLGESSLKGYRFEGDHMLAMEITGGQGF